jgi:organic hydroperoxide reductase OsmC/OhrA
MTQYSTIVEWTKDLDGFLKCGNGHTAVFSFPPEFNGRKGVFTPEDAFVASLNMCIHMTFLAVSRKARLNLVRYECEAKGETESEIGNLYHFSKVTLYPKIVVKGSSMETVQRLLGIAKKNCIVSNSVKCPVEISPEIKLEQG